MFLVYGPPGGVWRLIFLLFLHQQTLYYGKMIKQNMEFTKQQFQEEMQFKFFPADVAVGPEKAQGQFK